MSGFDLFVSMLVCTAAMIAWAYRREAHFAWASQGNAIEGQMAANDQLDDVREAFEAGNYAKVTEILSRTEHRA